MSPIANVTAVITQNVLVLVLFPDVLLVDNVVFLFCLCTHFLDRNVTVSIKLVFSLGSSMNAASAPRIAHCAI